MKILLLNEYFPPDTSATANMAAAVVDALAERHEVTVLCGRPSYDPSERHPFYLSRLERRGKIVVVRVGSTTFPRHRMLQRLLNYLSYALLAIPRALAIPTDVVLAMTDPPFEGIVGALVAWLKQKRFVYNIRDLYPEDTRERIAVKGINPGRVVVVRDGAQIPGTLAPRDHPVAREVRSGYSFVVLHAGNLGFYGAWETVVKAARMSNGDGVGFVFVGDGALRSEIEASANGCKAIRFLPFRPPDQVPYVLAAGDLHLVTIRRGLEGVVVPSKLYPILAAGRPVLALAPEDSDAARVIQRTGCGVVGNPDDPTSLVALVRELARDPERVAEMSRRATALAPEFSRAKELRRFLETMESVYALE